MMTLVRIMGQHWHAVERDLISLGYRRDDIGAKLTLWELISIVVAAPPGSAVYHAETRSGTLTAEAQLLANLGEQHAGLINLRSRYARSGVDSNFRPPQLGSMEALPNYKGVALTALPVEEHQAKLRELQEAARKRAGAN